MESLRGKIAIITGAGSGIGQGLASALAIEGVSLALCGRRLDRLESTVAGLSWPSGGKALALQADVSQEQDVVQVVNSTIEAFGQIDILINNAGTIASAPVHEMDVAAWDRVMATNLRGPFLTARAVLPVMRSQARGHIINISSEAGIEYYQEDGAYGVSKHALNALGEIIQRENQDFNIRVDTICPGMVWTEMTENDTGLNREKCLFPEDIAELVLWLLTRRANIKIGLPVWIQTMENPWSD